MAANDVCEWDIENIVFAKVMSPKGAHLEFETQGRNH